MNMPASLGTNSMIANLLSTVFVKKWNLDVTYLGIIFAINLAFIEYFTANISGMGNYAFELLNPIYLSICVLVVFVIVMFKSQINLYYTKWRTFFTDEMIISIYDPAFIQTYVNYMKNFPQFFDLKYNVNIGDVEQVTNLVSYKYFFNEFILPKVDTKINFDDTNLRIRGYVVCKEFSRRLISNESKSDNPININVKEIQICIKKSTSGITNAFDFKTMIKYYNKEFVSQSYKIILTYAKVSGPTETNNNNNRIYSTIIDFVFYDGPKKEFSERENLYINSFFHKSRDRLWKYLKRVDQDPLYFVKNGQPAQMNLLLYGPPGTGKSSFAYRVASTLNRNILSLDLHKLKKKTIYSFMHDPSSYDEEMTVKNVVYVFDEFDTIMEHLHEKESNRKQVKSVDSNGSVASEAERKVIKLKAKIKYLKSQMTKEKSDVWNAITKDDPTVTDLVMKDMLEIFQGIVPTEGRIIIATTNNYEKLLHMCPALFRHGRLTPVEFGYLDRERLVDLCNYYFSDSEIKFDFEIPTVMPIPTSEIIELAFESKFNNEGDPFVYFAKELQKKLAQ